jgi:GH24 family phage-related lysozyme (muramidase)
MGSENYISGSVGQNGRNARADVLVVQRLLASSAGRYGPLRPLTPNGVCNPETIEHILQFQRNAVNLVRPDGRVDPGGKTHSTLILYATGLPSSSRPPPVPVGPRATDVSQAGLRFIGNWEGLVLVLYEDKAKYATIGYGHLVHKGRLGTNPAAEGPWVNGITEERALELLHSDAATQVARVRTAVTVPLNQHQFDALVSLSFNIGPSGMASSTLVRLINQGNATDEQIRAAFGMWNKAGGKKDDGLANRRSSEARVYLQGKY